MLAETNQCSQKHTHKNEASNFLKVILFLFCLLVTLNFYKPTFKIWIYITLIEAESKDLTAIPV